MTLEEEWEACVSKYQRLAALIVRKRDGIPCGDDHYNVNYLTEIRWGTQTRYFKCLVCEGETQRSIDVHVA